MLAALMRCLATAHAGGTGVHRCLDDPYHLEDLVLGGRPLERGLPHDVPAHSAVADLGEDIDPDSALEPVEVLGKGLPTERGEELQGPFGDLLCGGKQTHEIVLVAGTNRCECVPAVSREGPS